MECMGTFYPPPPEAELHCQAALAVPVLIRPGLLTVATRPQSLQAQQRLSGAADAA